MIQREFLIQNPSGLHVRPASVLANALGKFESDAVIRFGGNDYNAKSVINIMAAGIKTGMTIDLQISGPDEGDAMDTAAALIESGLGE